MGPKHLKIIIQTLEVEDESGCGNSWALAWEQAAQKGNFALVCRGSQKWFVMYEVAWDEGWPGCMCQVLELVLSLMRACVGDQEFADVVTLVGMTYKSFLTGPSSRVSHVCKSFTNNQL